MSFVVESSKRVPVVYDVDVAVAGASVAGVFAALGAARNGAETVLIDRFGSVGGNIGPGMICNGTLASGQPHIKAGYQASVFPGFMGIAKEFIEKHAALGGGCIPPYSECHYLRDSSVASYTIAKMLEECGVNLLLSTYATDPIVEDNIVKGIFVENKSGRQAVKAKVVIDATGEADVAKRAGAPILYPKTIYHEIDGHAPTGMGLSFVVGGISWEKYETYSKEYKPSEEDIEWGKEVLGEEKTNRFIRQNILAFVRQSYESGEYRIQEVELRDAKIETNISIAKLPDEGLGRGNISPARVEEINIGDGLHISELEAKLRMYVFETVQLYKQYVPGFENAYVLFIAPFLGARGGPCIEGEYILTMDDCRAGRRFDDVIYLYGEFRALLYTCEQGECKWADVPYRVMLPKKIDGLLAVGRSASGIPDTLLRNRMAVKHMGEAGGTAAALCAKKDISPKELDVKELQNVLLDAGFYLGDRTRLKELGLI